MPPYAKPPTPWRIYYNKYWGPSIFVSIYLCKNTYLSFSHDGKFSRDTLKEDHMKEIALNSLTFVEKSMLRDHVKIHEGKLTRSELINIYNSLRLYTTTSRVPKHHLLGGVKINLP